MERILVSMNERNGAWEAWSRAVSLAKRIEARIYALFVMPHPLPTLGRCGEREASGIRRRLELQIELAKAEGIPVDYFISEGNYEEEVIRFADHNKITLLVTEHAEGENRHTDRGVPHVRKILHRINCRVELVSPRRIEQHCTQEENAHGYSTASVSSNRRK